ncbi:MAG: YraN family protein [Candidatus Omnitrophica bacterium]|nr:YraN family protein [Candidatus Omnitrophota bacterium]
MKKDERQKIGSRGEELALECLKQGGYEILEHNYKCLFGEIDIIAKDRGFLCFIEVKTRVNDEKGFPQEAVDKAKIRKISQNALSYLKKNKIEDIDMRFDVVSVLFDAGKVKIELIKDAFELDGRYF